jgi:hypothetical protein
MDPPRRIRVSADRVVTGDDIVILDHPQHLQLAWDPPPLVVPLSTAHALADLLDVPCSSELVTGSVSGGATERVPEAVLRQLGAAVPGVWHEHESLSVDGSDVTWWVTEAGEVHACTLDGLARALAWAAGRWGDRLLVAALLTDPTVADELMAERLLED